MGRLQTGTENKLAPLANRLATMPQKRLHKGILVRLSRFITSKGRLDGCHADLLEIRLQETPLLVRRAIVEPVDHRLGEIAGVETHAPGVRIFPIDEPRLVSLRRQGWIILYLPDTDAMVLHRYDISITPLKPLKEAIADRLPQPIDTDCNDAHRCP